jgi:hypothetical protein
MAKVSHANLVTVFDVGTHAGQVFIAMEYVAGRTLGQWLGPKRDWRDIVDVFCAAGRGLAAAHKVGLVHRDFKPANVLVADDGVAQVLDFGLVRRAGEADPESDDDDDPVLREDSLAIDLTRTGSVMGTPAYMAPEQHLGQPTDARSDQFAFCVALYEALYDERPFPGDDAGRVTVAVLENERRPKPKAGEIPDAIYRILDRGLSREPGDRYPAMEPLLDALAQEVMRARVPVARPSRAPWLLAIAVVLVAGTGVALALQDDAASVEANEVPVQADVGPEPAAERPVRPTAATAPPRAADPVLVAPDEPVPTPQTLTKEPRPDAPDGGAPAQDPGTALPAVDEEPLPTIDPEREPSPDPRPEPAPEAEPADD